mmetsp:Transcript_8912/g.32891  ORF Transcript_8912/g.32891 Transcript_8912/m.32891 type:complete len:216 (-) Transcript_8912:1369-2016(-)
MGLEDSSSCHSSPMILAGSNQRRVHLNSNNNCLLVHHHMCHNLCHKTRPFIHHSNSSNRHNLHNPTGHNLKPCHNNLLNKFINNLHHHSMYNNNNRSQCSRHSILSHNSRFLSSINNSRSTVCKNRNTYPLHNSSSNLIRSHNSSTLSSNHSSKVHRIIRTPMVTRNLCHSSNNMLSSSNPTLTIHKIFSREMGMQTEDTMCSNHSSSPILVSDM